MNNKVSLFKRIIVLLLVSQSTIGYAQKTNPKVYVIDYEVLETQKSLIKNGDKKTVENYNQLLNQADLLLNIETFSVVKKEGIPPSKSKHDYMSIGPYWWPNPDTSDGLPYIRKDGEINPETRNNFTDYIEKNNFIAAVKNLTKAYYFSDNVKYANKNLELIETWFLNAETKMNPNVNYG